MATISLVIPDKGLPKLAAHLNKMLDSPISELDKLTAQDFAIYYTPEGQLYTKLKEDFVPQVVEDTKNVRRAKGQKGLYSRADEEWEEQMRKELENKKKAEQNKAQPPKGRGKESAKTVKSSVPKGGKGRGAGKPQDGTGTLSAVRESEAENVNDPEKIQLAKESAVRKHVKSIKDQIERILHAITHIATSNQVAAHN